MDIERDAGTTQWPSALNTQQAPLETETLQAHHRLFSKFKDFSKGLFTKDSKLLTENNLGVTDPDSEAQIDEENLAIVQSGGENRRSFVRFEELPVELRLAVWEYYLEEARITTINFQSETAISFFSVGVRSYRLICGSIPPVICINHKYRDIFLERVTVPGLPTSLTTLSIEDAQKRIDDDESSTVADDSLANAFPVFATRRRQNIIYNPKDTVWIQGDFWLDELRRTTLARSVFYGLRHLAIPYKTRNQTIFEISDMWDLAGCIISTFPVLETITMVLDSADVIAERPIHNGEINFTTPTLIKMLTEVLDDTPPPPTRREIVSNVWKRVLRKEPPSPAIKTHIEYWTAEELASDASRILRGIKARAIATGYRFYVNSWETPRELDTWVVPIVRVVTASLSTTSKTREIQEPTIRIQKCFMLQAEKEEHLGRIKPKEELLVTDFLHEEKSIAARLSPCSVTADQVRSSLTTKIKKGGLGEFGDLKITEKAGVCQRFMVFRQEWVWQFFSQSTKKDSRPWFSQPMNQFTDPNNTTGFGFLSLPSTLALIRTLTLELRLSFCISDLPPTIYGYHTLQIKDRYSESQGPASIRADSKPNSTVGLFRENTMATMKNAATGSWFGDEDLRVEPKPGSTNTPVVENTKFEGWSISKSQKC
ncbi:hypothetical protein NHQ30_003609 [Ciborinia camelliae]|nr:hypothetical protein NHQ30_003609 [Ciborinia camelliae]